MSWMRSVLCSRNNGNRDDGMVLHWLINKNHKELEIMGSRYLTFGEDTHVYEKVYNKPYGIGLNLKMLV